MIAGNGIPKLLVELTQAIQGVEQFPVDLFTEDIKENEEVIGELSEGMQRLYVVHKNAFDHFNKAAELVDVNCVRRAHRPKRDDDELEHRREHTELNRLATRTELIGKIFWAALREEIPATADLEQIGIRKGGKVVSIPEMYVPASSLLGMLATALDLPQR